MIVHDRNNWIAYRGRIDDQYHPGVKRNTVAHHELRDALESLVRGESVAVPMTEPVGCLITYEKPTQSESNITYTGNVAKILFQHCLECHRVGEIGPFDVANYEEVRGWAEMIVETIEQKRMPPWHADSQHGSFKNARPIPLDAIPVLRSWIDAGTPYGNPKDMPMIPPRIEGWNLASKPDLIVEMRDRPYRVPAQGTVDYQYFVVDPKLTEDRWVTAAQIIPGDPSVVHHAIVFIRPPDGTEFKGIGWLTAYVPGQRATNFPPGYARRIPAGAKLVFQMHYTPNGQERMDRTKLGLNFTDASSVTHELITVAGIDQEFEIPPNASNHEVHGTVNRLPKHSELLAIAPHMHFRGKAFELRADHKSDQLIRSSIQSDPSSNILLRVPQYDFNWQHTYELQQPLDLSGIESLNFTVTFDNSDANPSNPNPNEYVFWGEQTWEEMAVVFLEVAIPNKAMTVLEDNEAEKPKSATEQSEDDLGPLSNVKARAKEFFDRYDRDKNGRVSQTEAPRIVRDYSFTMFDQDRDNELTFDEMVDGLTRSTKRVARGR